MKFDFPQFDLLVPGAAAIFLKFVGSSWMNAWFSQVPGIRSERIIDVLRCFLLLFSHSVLPGSVKAPPVSYSLWNFFNVSVVGERVFPVVNLLLSPH